jgi:regulator of PEP synthase PpsR (kinase-PPPase family)
VNGTPVADTRTVFFVSDGTGITAEAWGAALLSQFDASNFESHTIAFVTNTIDAQKTVDRINRANIPGHRPIVFSTTVDQDIKQLLSTSQALFIDLFDQTLPTLETELGIKSEPIKGSAHGISNATKYQQRMAAIEYSIEHDDGQSLRALDQADIILVAPSRCGKTPTSMYLSLQYGVKAANFPIVDEDFNTLKLPQSLERVSEKAFGLISTPQRLQTVRSERRPNSKYASIEQCRFEIDSAVHIFEKYKIPYLDSSTRSVEELASVAMDIKGLRS